MPQSVTFEEIISEFFFGILKKHQNSGMDIDEIFLSEIKKIKSQVNTYGLISYKST